MSDIKTSDAVRLTSLAHGGGCGCKIAPGVLSELLAAMPAMSNYPQLLVGTDTSDDAAVYQLNDEQALIATTDFFMPIVDDPYDFGRIAATNALSDVYAMGGTPIMALAIVGMPINTMSHTDIGLILKGGADVCQAAGIPVAGGHSIDSVEPIYGLAAMGLVHPAHVRKNAAAQVGDVLILTKGLGIGVMSAAFKKQQLSQADYAVMIQSTTQLNRPGSLLAKMDGVHALTDVTGFGLLGHAWEIARGSKVKIELNFAALPWLPNVPELASQGFITGASGRNWQAYGEHIQLAETVTATQRGMLTDPQTSGGLLISCRPDVAPSVLTLLHEQGFDYACQIGHVTAGSGVQVK